jgi:hypothetical protein
MDRSKERPGKGNRGQFMDCTRMLFNYHMAMSDCEWVAEGIRGAPAQIVLFCCLLWTYSRLAVIFDRWAVCKDRSIASKRAVARSSKLGPRITQQPYTRGASRHSIYLKLTIGGAHDLVKRLRPNSTIRNIHTSGPRQPQHKPLIIFLIARQKWIRRVAFEYEKDYRFLKWSCKTIRSVKL